MTRGKRRRAKLWERLSPCNCCGYPISQRHHLITVAEYRGENNYTRQLCANCHELYHICERAIGDILEAGPDESAKTRSVYCMNVLTNSHPEGKQRRDYMLDLIKLVNQARFDMDQERKNHMAFANQILEMFFCSVEEEISCKQ